MLDLADAPMPMTASSGSAAVMELHQCFGSFTQNAMIQKIARSLHEFFARMIHDGLLLISQG